MRCRWALVAVAVAGLSMACGEAVYECREVGASDVWLEDVLTCDAYIDVGDVLLADQQLRCEQETEGSCSCAFTVDTCNVDERND